MLRGKAIESETKCRSLRFMFMASTGMGKADCMKIKSNMHAVISATVRSGLHKTSGPNALRAAFSTSSSQAAPRTEGRDGRRGDNAFDINGIQKFQFDDTTSYGHMILEKKREKLELLQAIERDRSLLERKSTALGVDRSMTLMSRSEQRKPFQPPSKDQYLRFTTTIDLVTPTDASPQKTAHTHKSVVHVPIARLPLSDDAAIHRFKLLAGPRWIPPKDVVLQREGGETDAEEAHGWFKMSQDSFAEVRLNRQWLMDTMQKLVQEANVSGGVRKCAESRVLIAWLP